MSGLFDSFDNLDSIDINSLITWLKRARPTPVQLEDYLANKILYPTTISQTVADMEMDLAILREALRINGPSSAQTGGLLGDNPFLNITLRKIIIPERFLNFVPDLVSLTWAFVDGLLLNRTRQDSFWDLWTVVVSGDSDEIVGSVLLPVFGRLGENMNLSLLGKDYQIKAGSLTRIKCLKSRCEIAYTFEGGKILGKSSNAVEVYGGGLGLMIDGRIQ